MNISVIIVNYNVKFFLEQCLYSVQAAMKNTAGEIIVVDNNSTDDSLTYLQPLFPGVKFIANKENLGFGKACNTGFNKSSGEYIFLINPDTIIPEDCFEKCLAFIQSKKNAGITGIKMLDGSGKFLKESKRGFPSPFASFCKLFGLAALFPRSKTFARYYLGHLGENENHEADVIAGAFMLVHRNIYEKVNGFDEDFFMYGEDIDLSYRIKKAGYNNFYFADAAIIHFKGESTNKQTAGYIRVFYGAMLMFVRKHYSGAGSGLFKILLYAGIIIRSLFSVVGKIISGFSGMTSVQDSIKENKTVVVCSSGESAKLIPRLQNNSDAGHSFIHISPEESSELLNTRMRDEKADRIILCAGSLPYKKIIEMMQLAPAGLKIKIHASGSRSAVGSSSKDMQGDIIVLE